MSSVQLPLSKRSMSVLAATLDHYYYMAKQKSDVHTIIYTSRPPFWRNDLPGVMIQAAYVPRAHYETLDTMMHFYDLALKTSNWPSMHVCIAESPRLFPPSMPWRVHVILSRHPINYARKDGKASIQLKAFSKSMGYWELLKFDVPVNSVDRKIHPSLTLTSS